MVVSGQLSSLPDNHEPTVLLYRYLGKRKNIGVEVIQHYITLRIDKDLYCPRFQYFGFV